MQCAEVFPSDYFDARDRFRDAVPQGAWRLAASPVAAVGPQGELLTTDVLVIGEDHPQRVLIVSSGLHGVEGFFGSAVILTALRSLFADWSPPPGARVVLVHAINPWGFAHIRRTDEHNVDPNRNFLLAGQIYRGRPDAYERLNGLLNPRRPPGRIDSFRWRAYAAILRFGLPTLKQGVAAGQYEHPHGLFFGGRERSSVARHLSALWPDWTRNAQEVLHLDLHTGLGKSGRCKLLTSETPDAEQHSELAQFFGSDSVEFSDSRGIAYQVRGDVGRWCREAYRDGSYRYLCAEFGTVGPIRVLSALRAENQAHHFGDPGQASWRQAKQRLKEAFCPSSPRWRRTAIANAQQIIRRACRWLAQSGRT